LSDGVAINIGATGRNCAQPPCGWTNSVYHSDGTLVHDERFPAFPNGPGDTVVIRVGGGFSQLDADTGQTIAEVPESAGASRATFSRDRSRMALTRSSGLAVYDTSTWQILRVVPVHPDTVIWSPDGSEFTTAAAGSRTTSASVYSVVEPTSDRTVHFGGRACSPTDWSTTDRLALACELEAGRVPVVTLDARDGSELHTILGEPCSGSSCYVSLPMSGPIFSPSGSHLTIDELQWACLDPCDGAAPRSRWTSRIVVAPDLDGTSATPITEPFVTTPQVASGFGLLVSWRWS
jgi:hypothetical protein